MEAGRFTAGSSRTGAHRASAMTSARLDPFSLPVRFAVADEAADESLCIVDLHCERVVLRRSVRGMPMAVNLPVAAYRGVAIRLFGDIGKPPRTISVVLEHIDPALSLPLFCSSEAGEIVAEWQCWSRVLGLPLLIADDDGTLREPFSRLGRLRVDPPTWRRRRRSAVARRRPLRLLRRRAAVLSAMPLVHRGEREIIARN
jgi:Family of unknown function (DUF6101)